MPDIRRLCFVITDRCPVECDSCCFACSPRKRARLPLPVMLDYIGQAKETGRIRAVAVSGGEPFLHYGDVLKLARAARKNGLAFRTITNGYWARSDALVRRRLRELRDAGVPTLRVSADCFHADHIPLDRIRRLLSIAYAEGYPLSLGVSSTRSRPGLKMLVDRLGSDLHGVSILEFACLPAGRARTAVPPEDFIGDRAIPRMPCSNRMIIGIMPDGAVYSCCSVVDRNDMLRLGRAPRDSLRTLVENFWRSPMRRILHEHGVCWFTDRIRGKRIPIALDRAFVNDCHVCSEILAAPENRPLLEPLVEEFKREETKAFFRDWGM
ncbi:MAG: radical SAM protein [Elusimicrobiota bacterium]